MEFRAPIPGQSLTGAPGTHPWERPPELSDPEEVIQMYLTKLSDKEATENILDLLELDTSIVMLTEGILRTGVAEGLHSLDVSLIVAPVIHEFIKQTADAVGIDYEEGLEDKKAKEQKRKAVTKAKALKYLKNFKPEKETKEVESPMEIEEEMPMEEPQGFMKRRGVV
jgi:hypothetical protein